MTQNRVRHRVVAMVAGLAMMVALATPANAASGFGDTQQGDFSAPAIQWMVDRGLTTGTSAGCFSPGEEVDRGQLAVFIWRYLEEPAGGAHPFRDVPSTAFFSPAVAWMYDAGLTTGTSPTTYEPARVVTRGELAAFLWRLAGSPSAPLSGFDDVDRTAFYARAVDWLVDRGITTGTSASQFSPNQSLTRAQFATFLYRYDGSPSVVVQPGGVCQVTGESDYFGVVQFEEDFATIDGMDRFQFGLMHRDDHVVATTRWPADHADNGDGTCGGPDTVRWIERGDRDTGFNNDWNYWCPNGTGHMMTAVGDTSGYSIASFSPWETFTDVAEIRWDVNVTDLGGRQFPEIKIIPADEYDPNNLPCVPDIPCDTDDYDTLGAYGTSFFEEVPRIATPDFPDGYRADRYSGILCHLETDGFCHANRLYDATADEMSAAIRRTHIFRDNGNGTLSFSTQLADGTFHTLTGPGSFPDGPVRVVFADHSYTPTKDLGPLGSRFTWHWDNIVVAVDGNSLGANSLTNFGNSRPLGDLSLNRVDSDYCLLPEPIGPAAIDA